MSEKEFDVFSKGIFSKIIEEKWNIFVIDKYLYFATSWTDHCIFKVHFFKEQSLITLDKALVTIDKKQYNYNNNQQAKILLLQLIQVRLGRDDIYIDPAFDLDIIKQTVANHQPISRYRKSIGRQSVRINKAIYQSIQHFGKDYIQKTGWAEFYEKIKNMDDEEDILSLYMHDKETNKGITYHFDQNGKTLIGIIVPLDIARH